jgi:hypothetical protein
VNRRQFVASLAVSSVALPGVLSRVKAAPAPSPAPSACAWSDGIQPQTITIVGDVQRTGMAEQVILSRPQNDSEREMILNAIGEERPDMVLMLGDQVFAGGDDGDWSYFDRIMGKINGARIPVRAMLGNHDLMGLADEVRVSRPIFGSSVSAADRARCVHNFCERFPHQKDEVHGLTRLGSIALVTLDSNFDQLTAADIRKQADRYKDWLSELDRDPSVKGVIVASHHPPYTNSDLPVSQDIADLFARPFLAARKTRLYLSGHVHSYERFVAGDKMFVVSGGGGGPRRLIDTSADRPYHNDAYRIGTLRPFHYMRLTVKDDSLSTEVVMLNREGKLKVGDSFDLGLYA